MQHRAEDLVAVALHVGGHVREDRGADPVAVRVALHRLADAVERQRRARVDARAHEPLDALLGLRRVERRHVNARHLMESRGRKLSRDPEATPRLQAAAAALWGTQEADEARCSSKGED